LHKSNYSGKKFTSNDLIAKLPISGFSQIHADEPDVAKQEK